MENYLKKILNQFNPDWHQWVEDGQRKYADVLAEAVVQKIFRPQSVSSKMTLLNLIDNLVNNAKKVDEEYILLFAQNIAEVYASVFADTMRLPAARSIKYRRDLYNIRVSWNSVFSKVILMKLDINVKAMDKKWPTQNIPKTIDSMYESEREKYRLSLEIHRIEKELKQMRQDVATVTKTCEQLGVDCSSRKPTQKRLREIDQNNTKGTIDNVFKKKWDEARNARETSSMLTPPPEEDDKKPVDVKECDPTPQTDSFWKNTTSMFDVERHSPISMVSDKCDALPFIIESENHIRQIESQPLESQKDQIAKPNPVEVDFKTEELKREQFIDDFYGGKDLPTEKTDEEVFEMFNIENESSFEILDSSASFTPPIIVDKSNEIQSNQSTTSSRKIKINISAKTLKQAKLLAATTSITTDRMGREEKKRENPIFVSPSKIEYELKPSIKGKRLTKQAARRCGIQESALCSIM